MRFRDWLTTVAAFAAVAVAIFAVGGVLRWTQATVAVLVAISLGAMLVSRRGLSRVSPLVALLSTAAVLTGLQLIPLPRALVDGLNPTAAALRSDGSAVMDVSSSSALTSDVPATIGAFVFFLVLLGIAIAALRAATTETGRYRLIAGITLLCGLVAAVVGIHHLFGLQALYGIYRPSYAAPIMLGPLLNANSLACLMAAGAMLGIGLAAHRRQSGWLRAVWLMIVASCGAITVATVSRGATLAFAAGALVTIGIIIGQRLGRPEGGTRRRSRFITSALPIGIVAGCMVVLVIWMNAGNVERQLSQLSFDELHYSRSKFVAWRSSAQLIEESPWLGVGRGAFESSFTRVHPAAGVATYSYVENEYIQAVVDWGIPGALALGFMAIWLAFVGFRRWRDGPLTAGALGALTVVAIQANVDFGIEFLGLAAPLTVIAATLGYVPLREIRRPVLVRVVRVGHVAALLVGAVLLFSARTTTLDEDHRALATNPTLEHIRASIERHPLDYYGYAVAADLMDRKGDRKAIRVLNHAMLLHPTHPDLHRIAARMLYRDGYIDQATIEYAAALHSSPDPSKLVSEILKRFSPEKAADALPVDFPIPQLLVRIMSEQGHSDVATRWLDRVLQQRPKDSRACEQLSLLAQAGSGDAALIAAHRCVALLPDYQTRFALAQQLFGNKQFSLVPDVLDDIETWQTRADDKINAWLLVCDAHTALEHVDDAKRCLRRLDASPDMRRERGDEIVRRLIELQKPPAGLGSAATGSAATP